MDENLQFNDEWLLKYFDGELNPDQQKEIEAALANDPALAQRLASLRLSIDAVKHYGTIDKVKIMHANMMKELEPPRQTTVTPVRKIIRYSMAVAAGILILFFAIRFLDSSQNDAERLFKEAYVEYDVSGTRGGAPGGDLEKAYAAANYKEVIKIKPVYAKDSLLTGLAHLKLNHPSPAILWLQPLSLKPGDWQQDAEFYLSMAYLKVGAYDKAYELMQKIRSDKNHIYKDQFSNSFISRIEKLKERSN